VVAAIAGGVALLVVSVLVGLLIFRSFRVGKEVIQREWSKIETEQRAAAEQAKAAEMDSVELQLGSMPEYALYKAGDPLTPEMFLAWKVDPGATSLLQAAFKEKADGAEVTWRLQTDNLRSEAEEVTGDFWIPYKVISEEGDIQNRVIRIRCQFAREARDSLLTIRRGDPVKIRGRLSLKDLEPVLLEARPVIEGVEKE
jgi:hypothetical protein